MPAPPPHQGPCKRCEKLVDEDGKPLEITKLGRYRGLCEHCRPLVAAEQKAARGERQPTEPRTKEPRSQDGVNSRDHTRRPKLREAVERLLPLADQLDLAAEDYVLARMRANGAVGAFKEGVREMTRVAQSLLNQTTQLDAPE